MSAAVAQAIRGMMAAGFTLEQALLAIEKMDEAKRGSAKSNAERQAEFRARQKAARNAVTSNESNVTSVTPSRDIQNAPTHAEPEPNKTTSSPVQKDILTDIPKVPAAKPKSADALCVAELGRVLDPERAQAVVDHRNRMRKPMTAHAAGLLAKRLSSAPDPNAAADEMIERGWQGWRPEWGQNSQAPPHRQARGTSLADGLDEFNRMYPGNVEQFPRLTG